MPPRLTADVIIPLFPFDLAQFDKGGDGSICESDLADALKEKVLPTPETHEPAHHLWRMALFY